MPWIEFAAWVGAEVALVVTMALLTTSARPRAALGAVPVAIALALPWIAPHDNALRFWLALASTLCSMVYLELVKERAPSPTRIRLWMALTPADVRLAERAPPRFDAAGAAMLLVYAALAGLGFLGVYRVAPLLDGWAYWVARWAFGLVFGYCLFDAVVHAIRVAYRALGVELPPMHDAPLLSRTVAELWAKRWNQTVHTWLRRHFFWPLARRRRPLSGVALAFVASAALHAWIFAPLGVDLALAAGTFFVVQGALVLAERRLDVAGWRPAAQRAWTVPSMVLSSPLFIEPFLQILE